MTCRYRMVFVFFWERVTNLKSMPKCPTWSGGSKQTWNQMEERDIVPRPWAPISRLFTRKISAITSSNWNKKCGCQILWLVIWFIVFYEFRQLQRSRFMELAGVLLASALQIGRCHGYGSNPLSSGCVIFMEKRSPLFTSIWICPEI